MPSPRPRADTVAFSVRVAKSLHARAQAIAGRGGVYTPSIAQMVERGLELAVAEQEGTLRIDGDPTPVAPSKPGKVRVLGVLLSAKPKGT